MTETPHNEPQNEPLNEPLNEPQKDVPKKAFDPFVLFILILAIPAGPFYLLNRFGGIRNQSRQTTLISDGRQIGSAAQQYFLTSGPSQSQASLSYNSVTGEITGDLTPWLNKIGKGYTLDDLPIESGLSHAFSLQLPRAFLDEKVWFSDEGKSVSDPSGLNWRFSDFFR